MLSEGSRTWKGVCVSSKSHYRASPQHFFFQKKFAAALMSNVLLGIIVGVGAKKATEEHPTQEHGYFPGCA